MSEDHVVSEGEHLARIAGFRGFRSYAPLWNDPANEALRRQRTNPNILAVGDHTHVPTLELREVDRATEKRHRFRAELHPLVVRLGFLHWDGRAPESGPTSVLVDGKDVPFVKTAVGISFPVDAVSDRCTIRIGDGEVSMRVGFLQPAATVAGQRERLTNLGYDAGESDKDSDIQLRSAIEEFQCDHGLVVDGKCGPNTQKVLVHVHGC